MRYAFAGDRDISVKVLRYLLDRGDAPEYLLVAAGNNASHAEQLIAMSGLPESRILRGPKFREPTGRRLLAQGNLDLILSIHFPYLVTEKVLPLAKQGVLNLHPSYLPWNRGWHTPTWGILDNTPAGGTLHFMDEGIDTGDIIHQVRATCEPWDTADSLYAKILAAEYQAFVEEWPRFRAGESVRRPQAPLAGSSHVRVGLRESKLQQIDLDEISTYRDVLARLRAMTTNRTHEAAFLEVDGQRYHVQVSFVPAAEQPT